MSRIELPGNYCQRDGTLMDVDFTLATVTNGTGVASAAYTRNRAQSLKVDPSTNSCLVQKTLTTAVKINPGDVVGLWVYLKSPDGNSSPVAATGMSLLLGNQFDIYGKSLQYGFAGYHVKWDQWNYLVAHTSDTGQWNKTGTGWTVNGTGTLSSNVTHVAVAINNMSVAGIEVYIDSIEINQRSRPKIIFGFDALSTDLTTYALPMLTALGITGYATYNHAGGSPTSAVIARQWRDAGWEIVNHGYAHATIGTMTTDAEIITEVEDNWLAMQDEGLIVAGQTKGWIGPQNSTSPRANRVLQELGYVWGRNYKNHVTKTPRDGVDNLLDMGSIDLGNPTSLARITGLMEAALALGGTTWLFAHGVDTTSPATGPTGNNNTIYLDDLEGIANRMVELRDSGMADLPQPSEWYKGLTQPRVIA